MSAMMSFQSAIVEPPKLIADRALVFFCIKLGCTDQNKELQREK